RSRIRAREPFVLAGGIALSLFSLGLLISAWRVRAERARELAQAADQARARLRTLSEVAVALSRVRTKAEVAEVVVEQGTAAMQAELCLLHLLDETGTLLELLGERGVSP